MVPLLALWLPIVLSAVVVFIVSSIIHTVLGYHRNDFAKLSNEDAVMTALRPFDLAPGEYVMPYAGSSAAMKSTEYQEKLKAGPVAFMTVMPRGTISMGTSLVQWFGYALLVGIFAAYIAGRALGPGAPFGEVLRFAGTAAFLGYSLALLQNSIWYRRRWRTTLISVFDGLVYALLTGLVFAWLWPA